jgi:ATP-dependent exoDNAse (exonuclease V) alpha subunit
LCWHDSGWDGAVCKNPERNKYCTYLDHIREVKDKDFEKEVEMPNARRHLSQFNFDETSFPCRGDICAFSDKGYPVKLEHPLKGKVPGFKLDPCVIDPAPFSFCPAPYRWLIVDNYEAILKKENLELRELTNEDKFYYTNKIRKKYWIDDVHLQEALLKHFWNQLEEKRSLIAFYVNSTPAAEDKRRVIVGLGRLEKKYKMSLFGNTVERPGPNFAWQRQLSHNYPEEGFRLPFQEYLEQGLDAQRIAVTVPMEVEDQFKFMAEHVSDDAMLSVVEKVSNVLEVIIDDVANGKARLTEDWNKHRFWLQKVIEELWQNRGQHPGVGSVLQFLGFNRGMTYHREILAPLQKQNLDTLQHVADILDGKKDPEESYRSDFANAKSKWMAYSSDPHRRELLILLMRMEVSEDQAERLLKDDLRLKSGIAARIDEIINNPYLIAENDKGLLDEKDQVISERISLDTVDHAIVPAFNFKGRYRPDDDRRVRAVMIEELKLSAEEGDTLLSMNELIDKVHRRFEGERECRPDLFLVKANRSFYESRLEFLGDNDEFVSLKEMRNCEKLVTQKIGELMLVEHNETNPDWNRIMNERFGSIKNKFEEGARTEKDKALEILFNNKFSVLTGRAGTGKTEVVSLLIEGILEKENCSPSDFLVLAPTGKARVRLKKNFGKIGNLSQIEPKTIHQHLNEHGWLDRNFELRESGGAKTSARTIIVDECSMMPVDLLATLIKSLELGNVRRFILVGDPNQLPPIGPGRPLDDIVNWLFEKKQRKKHISHLTVRMRHGLRIRQDDNSESICLQLADGFLRDFKSKDIEEVYSLIHEDRLDKTHDLFFAEWDDYEELLQKLDYVLEEIGVTDYDSYRISVGLSDGDLSRCESWQVLSPLKHREVSGTISLNSYLQNKFLAGTLSKWRTRAFYGWKKRFPSPFGSTKDIVDEDKVIQTRNTRRIRCLPPKTDRYVANGEIGIGNFDAGKNTLNVTFSDQPEYSYAYYTGDSEQSVERNLDLAYAITIHKSQGSDFEKVIVIIPEKAFNISMEMMYTALTRFKGDQGKTYLLVQKGIETLEQYRRASSSETDKRNTYLFKIVVRDDVENIPYAENRIHRTKNGFLVRSKSEVIVANELINAGISLTEKNYESRVCSRSNAYDYKLPDFTLEHNGKKFYWEHLGMLGLESYRRSWERKKKWYEENGYIEHLITSKDGPDGSIDSKTIDRIIEERLGTGKGPKKAGSKQIVRVRTRKSKQDKKHRSRGS